MSDIPVPTFPMKEIVLLSFVPETRDNIGEERDDEDS